MAEYHLGEIEMKFADIIWENEPLKSGELIKLCEQALGWKKSTTYTILKRVSERGLFQNVDGVVTSCVKKDEFMAKQTQQFLDANFEGPLPKFLAAFAKKNKFSEKEIEEINKIIRS